MEITVKGLVGLGLIVGVAGAWAEGSRALSGYLALLAASLWWLP